MKNQSNIFKNGYKLKSCSYGYQYAASELLCYPYWMEILVKNKGKTQKLQF